MIDVAVVGIGAWGKNTVRDFSQIKKANLIYCYDKSDVSLDWVRQSYPEVKVTSNYERILNDKKIDAVVIVTPTPTPDAHAYTLSGSPPVAQPAPPVGRSLTDRELDDIFGD